MRRAITAFLLVVFIVPSTQALEDTPENRQEQATRYVSTTPPVELLTDMAKQMATNLPEDKRKLFVDLMTKHMDMKAFEKIMHDAMVVHFSADELKALADFYGSAIGKSAMGKIAAYTADIMPHIKKEVMNAQQKAANEIQQIKKAK